jgi:hypothetical protein
VEADNRKAPSLAQEIDGSLKNGMEFIELAVEVNP